MAIEHQVSPYNQDSEKANSTSWLGLQLGQYNLLVNLADVIEVLPVPLIQPVPLTRHWFLGMANVRGNLISVSDFSLWLGLKATKILPSSRIILLNSVRATQCAILVDGVVGLQNMAAMQPLETPYEVAFPALEKFAHIFDLGQFTNANQQSWLTLNVDNLLTEPTFLYSGLAAA